MTRIALLGIALMLPLSGCVNPAAETQQVALGWPAEGTWRYDTGKDILTLDTQYVAGPDEHGNPSPFISIHHVDGLSSTPWGANAGGGLVGIDQCEGAGWVETDPDSLRRAPDVRRSPPPFALLFGQSIPAAPADRVPGAMESIGSGWAEEVLANALRIESGALVAHATALEPGWILMVVDDGIDQAPYWLFYDGLPMPSQVVAPGIEMMRSSTPSGEGRQPNCRDPGTPQQDPAPPLGEAPVEFRLSLADAVDAALAAPNTPMFQDLMGDEDARLWAWRYLGGRTVGSTNEANWVVWGAGPMGEDAVFASCGIPSNNAPAAADSATINCAEGATEIEVDAPALLLTPPAWALDAWARWTPEPITRYDVDLTDGNATRIIAGGDDLLMMDATSGEWMWLQGSLLSWLQP